MANWGVKISVLDGLL